MTGATNLLSLLAGAAAVTAQFDNKNVAIISKVIEGQGLAKAIQIKSLASRSIRLTDFSIAIAFNGQALGDENVVYRFPEYGRESSFREFLYTDVTLCTEDAVEQDLGGILCGYKPIIIPSQSPVLSFNGNDMLVLRRRDDGVDTIIDIFGNDSGDRFEICGRDNANIESILTRKSSVVQGQLKQLSAQTPCEWDYEPLILPFSSEPFSTVVPFNSPVSNSVITLRDDDGGDMTELFLSADGVEKIRVKDMEKGIRETRYPPGTNVCIKQESYYISNQESRCDYIWDADLGATDPETGGPIPFTLTVSGAYRGNLERFIRRGIRVGFFGLSQAECAITTENPIDTRFKNYVTSYECPNGDDDCKTVGEQWGMAAKCRTKTSYYVYNNTIQKYEYFPLGVNFTDCRAKEDPKETYDGCYVDGQCGSAGTFCSTEFGGCRSTTQLMKVRSTNADNMVIPAGETRTVNFNIDSTYGSVSNGGAIHFITNAAAELSYEVTESPSGDVIGDTRTLSACEASEVEGGATAYYRLTADAYLQSDDTYRGLWNYAVTNKGPEDVTLLAVFKDFDTRED